MTKTPSRNSTNPFTNKANKYARDIVAGKIPACSWVIKACQRHLDDLARSKRRDFPYRFDPSKVERVCRFLELLPHTKGKWAQKRELLKLQPWQVFKTAALFGWVRKPDGLRRFRQALILEPRKNGKSAWAAGIGLYMLAADNEHGAEVYSGATTEKQAWEVFRPARLMAQKTPAMQSHFGLSIHAKNLSIAADGSRFEPMIGNPGDGSSPHCALVDEYHEHETDDMVSTMVTGMGAREQPLLLIITTAGANVAGPCYQAVVEARLMLDGAVDEPELFALMYGVDKDDDWTDPASLRKANPNFDVSVREDYLLGQLRAAVNNARKSSAFRTKHLNEWVFAKEAYFNVAWWMEAADKTLNIEDFKGQQCTVGIDLASKNDIASVVYLFRKPGGGFAVFANNYLPEKAVEAEATGNYAKWADDGQLIITDGNIIDHGKIQEDIEAASEMFDIVALGYDIANATMLVVALANKGLNMVQVKQTVTDMSEPMKEVEALIRAKKIAHDGGECLSWQIGNVVAKPDAKDNVYPRKERLENKIDAPVALIMAMRLQINEPSTAGMDSYFASLLADEAEA